MSTQGIGALERGDRRTPQRETLKLLIEALELGPEQRIAFEAAALRQSSPRPEPARDAFPPPFPSVPDPLPVSLTSFVGRESEVDDLAALLLEHRLITITGPGGIGKTRMALDVSRFLSGDFPDAVGYVELAPVGDSGFILNAIAESLKLGESPGRSAFDTLAENLQQRRVLLVIDNCEHLIAEVALEVERLLRACPQLTILATSREPLRVPGERVYRLPSLRAPSFAECAGLSAAAAATFPAIRLFAERAVLADRTFVLDDRRAPIVAEICAALDGIPLAIELAAARVTALSLAALAQNLRRQLVLPGGGIRTANSRQQTMRAAIDWSYDLLGEPERRLFTCLAVFAGGWSIGAAAAVADLWDDEGSDPSRVFDLLSSLVDKSLVVADLGGVVPRYRMLEPFRQYAREKLIERGELENVSRRHAEAFLKIAREFAQTVGVEAHNDAYAAARLDIDNLRTALEWCLGARNDIPMGQLIASNLRMLWGWFSTSEGRRWTQLALDVGAERTPHELAAVLERMNALLCWKRGEYGESLAAATRALSHLTFFSDELEIARAEFEAAAALRCLGRTIEAQEALHRALAKAQQNRADRLTAKILYELGQALSETGDFAGARAACARAFEFFPDAKGDRRIIALITRAEIEFQAGDAAAALRFNAEACDELPVLGDNENAKSIEANLCANAAAYLVSLGRYAEARAQARNALAIATDGRFPSEQAWALQHLAAISVLARDAHDERSIQDVERAARLLGYVSKRYDEMGGYLGKSERLEIERMLEALGAALSADRLAWLQTRGATMNEAEAIAEAVRVPSPKSTEIATEAAL